MSLFDQLFDPRYVFDNEHQQRSDIEELKSSVAAIPNAARMVSVQASRIDRVELLCKALVELVVARKLATREEVAVLVQQVDLADGLEDGRAFDYARKDAPRCASCTRFLNPQRERCIYCGAEAVAMAAERPAPAPPRVVTCGACSKRVPESETYFTGNGIRCGTCFDPTDG